MSAKGTRIPESEILTSGGRLTAGDLINIVQTTDPVTYNLRTRATVAQVNAGLILLAVPATHKFRLIDCTLIAIGGNAGGGTGVQVKCGNVSMVNAAVAALTRSAVVKPNSADVTVVADGASFVAMTAGDDVTIIKDGNNITTSTHFDVILTYALDPA